jgi:hypothetical protein
MLCECDTLKATMGGMEAATGRHLLKQQILSATCKRNRQQGQGIAGRSTRMRSSHECRARDDPGQRTQGVASKRPRWKRFLGLLPRDRRHKAGSPGQASCRSRAPSCP